MKDAPLNGALVITVFNGGQDYKVVALQDLLGRQKPRDVTDEFEVHSLVCDVPGEDGGESYSCAGYFVGRRLTSVEAAEYWARRDAEGF